MINTKEAPSSQLSFEWLKRRSKVNVTCFGKHQANNNNIIIPVPDFQSSHLLTLNDVFLMNHMFVALLKGLHNYTYCNLFMLLFYQSYYSCYFSLMIVKIFLEVTPKKPPDPEPQLQANKILFNSIAQSKSPLHQDIQHHPNLLNSIRTSYK
jgi:hypothetical protein